MSNSIRLFGFLGLHALCIFITSCACPDGKQFNSVDGERINEIKALISKMDEKQIAETIDQFKFAKEFLPRQVIVRFKAGTASSKVEETLSTLGAFKTHQFKSTQALLLTIPDAITRNDILAIVTALNEVQSVDYAVPNGILKVSVVPNDPAYPQQDDLKNTGQTGGTPGADVRAEGAWNISQGSENVVVGIIDTGVDYLHPDLVDNIWTNPGEVGTDIEGNDKRTNGIDDDENGYVDDLHGYDFVNNDSDPMDDYGHGTHVAGTIGARGNNGIGMTGINWRVKLAPLKVFGADGSGSDADIIKAIEYANQMNIPITNNSYGGLGYNQATRDAIEASYQKGFLFVAAAGNFSVDNDIVNFFPANYGLPNIISVAAVDNKDAKPNFSNWGARKVDIAAPGVDILSLAVSGSAEPLIRMSGTSMAAPHVAGAAALIKAAYPELNFLAVKNRILFGADPVPQLLSPTYSYDFFRMDDYPIDNPLVRGGRRLNIEKSLEADFLPPGSVEGLRVSFSGLTQLELRFQRAGDDGNSGQASGYVAVVSSEPITSEAGWAGKKILDLNHMQVQSDGLLGAEVVDLEYLQRGYLTLRAVDNAGNLGSINPSIPFEMSQPRALFANSGDSTEGINFRHLFSYSEPYGQEEVEGRGKVWSDSPNGNRDYNYKYMEFTQNTEVPHPDVVLQFDTKLDCVAVFERAEVDIRINDETDPFSHYYAWNPERGAHDWFQSPKWRRLAVYSAPKCEWGTVRIPLRNKLKVGDKVRFRFFYRGGGDPSDGHDGWLIDDIKLLGAGAPEKPTSFVARQATETSPYVLQWTDNSNGETRFEIRKVTDLASSAGELVAQTAINVNRFETGQTRVDSQLRVRACNGTVCSEFSDPVYIMAPPPRVTSVSPAAGPLAGGNTLTVQGANFSSGASVRIQGVVCPDSIRVSAAQMTCKPAARAAGTYNVVVINPDSQRGALVSAYTYQPAPSIAEFSPAIGRTRGGETVTVTGTGFVAGATVQVGGRLCPNSTVISSTQIQCTTPANAEGSHALKVTNLDGQESAAVPSRNFRVINPRWVSTNGSACSRVCQGVGLSSRLSPEGSYCTSGEMIPPSAVGKVAYRHGCWPFRDCRSQGTYSAIQAGKYCYGATQRRDSGRTDITVGCYCDL